VYNVVRQFQVQLGHLKVIVEALDAEDAVRRARNRFCQDHPRLWDIITRLEAHRFEVACEGANVTGT
jgi:hypothetical protein